MVNITRGLSQLIVNEWKNGVEGNQILFELTKFKLEGFYSMIIKKKNTKEIINDYNNNNNNYSNTAVKENEEKSVNKHQNPERETK